MSKCNWKDRKQLSLYRVGFGKGGRHSFLSLYSVIIMIINFSTHVWVGYSNHFLYLSNSLALKRQHCLNVADF